MNLAQFILYAKILKLSGGGGGGGDMFGPSSSVDNAVAVASGTSGKNIKYTPVYIDPNGNVDGVNELQAFHAQLFTLKVLNQLDLNNYTPNWVFVSNNGSDTQGFGTQVAPYQTIEYADNLASGSLNITPGSYSEATIATKPVAWCGAGKDITTITSSILSLDNTAWQAATSPAKLIKDVSILGGGSGQVLEINVSPHGSGYSSAPAVGFTGGGGSGAAATAILGKAIASVAVVDGGEYTEIPTMSATLGVGATFGISMTALNAASVNRGAGYVAGSKIVVAGGTFSSATVLNIDSVDGTGGITGLSVASGGVYTALPTNPISDNTSYYADCYIAGVISYDVIYADGPNMADPGVGATITNNGIIAPFFADGVFVPEGSRVLLKQQLNASQNGIYVLTYNGSEGGNWIMTRATDFDTPLELERYAKFKVTNGNTQANTTWAMTGFRPVIVGSAPITFSKITGAEATFNITGWAVNAVTVTAGGSDYESTSNAVFSGAGPSSAIANLTLAATGSVKRATVDLPGSGYSSAPAIGFTGGGGSGASATAIVSPLSGNMNFTPSTYKANSSYIIDASRLPSTAITALATNLIFENGSETSNHTIKDIANVISEPGTKHAGTLTISGTNIASVATMTFKLTSNYLENIVINTSNAGGAIDLTITGGAPNSIVVNDTSTASKVTIRMDSTSYVKPTFSDKEPTVVLINFIPAIQTAEVFVEGIGAAAAIDPATTTQNLVAIGPLAGASIPNAPTNQSRSTFIGYNVAASYTTSGGANDQHTGVGYFALRLLSTGQFNTAFGAQAGFSVTTGSNNTFLGSFAGVPSSGAGNAQNRTALGSGVIVGNDNQVAIGDSNVTSIVSNGSASLGTPSNPFNNLYFPATDINAFYGNTVFKTGTQSIAGSKTFSDPTTLKEVTNPLIENITPVSLTANSGTITAGQLVSGVIVFTPTANATWTFPLGTDIDSVLGAPSANRGRKGIRFVNNSAFSISFVANTGMNFGGLSTAGTLSLSSNSDLTFDLEKVDTAPTYSTFGPSYGSLSYNIQGYAHNTNWTGIWASDQVGNVVLTRIADQVFMTIPIVSATSNAASVITMVTAIPAQFRPSSDIRIGVPCIIDSTQANSRGNGAAKVSSSGIVTMYKTGNDGTWPSGATTGFDRQTLNWSIS